MTEFSGQNLTCQRGDTIIFSNLSFAARAGETVLIQGANGSGKSSLLRVLAGLLHYQGTLDGVSAENRHWIGTHNPLKPDLSVLENLNFWKHALGSAVDVASILPHMNLEKLAHKAVRHLSAGQKRRVTLCRLFLSDRPLWLLDEPETGLDAAHAKLLCDHIQAHAHKGGIALIATHRPDLWPQAKTITLEAA